MCWFSTFPKAINFNKLRFECISNSTNHNIATINNTICICFALGTWFPKDYIWIQGSHSFWVRTQNTIPTRLEERQRGEFLYTQKRNDYKKNTSWMNPNRTARSSPSHRWITSWSSHNTNSFLFAGPSWNSWWMHLRNVYGLNLQANYCVDDPVERR